MNSYFAGVTFPNQRVTPTADALIHRAILPDGILSGCEVSYSGSTLTMGAGFLIACGREFRHAADQNWAVADAISGYARLILTIDLSRTATENTFDQVVAAIEYAVTEDGFPALIQDDINSTGTVYQVVVCVVSLSVGGITSIVSQLGVASIPKMLDSFRKDQAMEKLWENADPSRKFSPQKILVDLAEFDGVYIYYRNRTTGTVPLNTGLIPLGHSGVLWYVSQSSTQSTRRCMVEPDGITFESGKRYDDIENTFCVPTMIYGVKRIPGLAPDEPEKLPSWYSLLDKPFYEADISETLLENRTFTGELLIDYGYTYSIPEVPFQFVVGETYSVTWDGVEFRCIAMDASASMAGAVCIGDASGFELSGNNEPFLITTTGTGLEVSCLTDSEQTEHNMAISHVTTVIKKLDPRFLPAVEISWNDLLDRPFGEKGETPEIFNAENLEFGDSGMPGLYAWESTTSTFPLVEGVRYLIVWDTVGYYCDAVAANLGGVDGIGIGNFAIAGLGENTEEPFLIGVAVDGSAAICYTTENAETHSVTIYSLAPLVKTLDAKYLPSPVSVDLSAYESEGKIVETYADGSAITTVMEFDANGNPIKITDSNGNVTVLTW